MTRARFNRSDEQSIRKKSSTGRRKPDWVKKQYQKPTPKLLEQRQKELEAARKRRAERGADLTSPLAVSR